MPDSARAVLQRLVDAFRIPGQSLTIAEWVDMAEEALAAPTPPAVKDFLTTAPAPPADGEAEELAQFLDDCACAHFAHGRPQFARAAALLRQLPPEGLSAASYDAGGDVLIQRTRRAPDQRSGAWAIRWGIDSLCMSHTGEWEIEPRPSDRTHEWMAAHRWPTLAAAWEALQQARRQEVGDE